MIKTSIPDLIIDHISGNCPVQAEGTIAGEPFYFRARGNNWSFMIGTFERPQFLLRKEYGSEPYDAGWMDET